MIFQRCSYGKSSAGRLCLLFVICLAMPMMAIAAEMDEWESYKVTFISSDGRVIDHQQAASSHSEGQGYGMLLAVAHDDKNAFDSIFRWAVRNLQKRQDKLFAWKWGKRPDGTWGILDTNNATDGDLLIAFALKKAADKWDAPAYNSAAALIATDLRRKTARTWQGKRILAPAAQGFDDRNGLIFNPSYVIPRAYRALAAVDDASFWNQLGNDGETVIYAAVFGVWSLPPDWLSLQKKATPHPTRGTHFSHDAIRVILHTAEPGAAYSRLGLMQLTNFVLSTNHFPEQINLLNDEISIAPAPAGYYSVLARAAELSGQDNAANTLRLIAASRADREERTYYSTTLRLLVDSKAME